MTRRQAKSHPRRRTSAREAPSPQRRPKFRPRPGHAAAARFRANRRVLCRRNAPGRSPATRGEPGRSARGGELEPATLVARGAEWPRDLARPWPDLPPKPPAQAAKPSCATPRPCAAARNGWTMRQRARRCPRAPLAEHWRHPLRNRPHPQPYRRARFPLSACGSPQSRDQPPPRPLGVRPSSRAPRRSRSRPHLPGRKLGACARCRSRHAQRNGKTGTGPGGCC
mmetsp:Transcript_84502/g.244011  ORF Transcript_84502/g.244011 Transcript_84502/m.244011 type:complete len:225 (-) Transcript_84502:281-955(-)